MSDHPDTKTFSDENVGALGEDIYNIRLEQGSSSQDTAHDTKSCDRSLPVTSAEGPSGRPGVSDTDFKIRFFPKKESGEDQGVQATPTVSVTSDRYDMSHRKRGRALIVNNERFSYELRQQGFGERHGSGIDEANLKKQLKDLGFEVRSIKDVGALTMKNACKDIATLDHSNYDCFVCVILTHGEEGIVYGKDKAVEIKDLAEPFRGHNCPSLAGKPKIFIIQACRGHQTDPGVNMNVVDARPFGPDYTDAGPIYPDVIKLPVDADFLFAYSTVPGYYSWRNGANGSWFIQALCGMLANHGTSMEFLKLLTAVNKMVAQNFKSSNPGSAEFHGMKQIPCITSMLTKDLYFTKK